MSGALTRVDVIRQLWKSTIGKKMVMAVTGMLMVAFLLAHMAGNLKIFFGPSDFDHYAHWLRTIGEPVLHDTWYLWIQRVVLGAATILHIVSAAQLSKRDVKARPISYAHGQRAKATFATRTMRLGGIILALFIVWHILDLTAGAINPHFAAGHPYHNVVADFQVWWINIVYIVPVVLLGVHINHGFWSAGNTLGLTKPGSEKALKIVGTVLAVVITLGFISIPCAVMGGLVR